ncbi:MAG: excinuclease ABC subunit UvrB [Eubacterium sp.]|nr:excinuclease ABC subunit UvrB [Eubacterium sp.]
MSFKLHMPFQPTGDQPQAIERIVQGFREGNQFETLLGVTGSGKTFTMANVIQALDKPTLVIAHNKTLATQLYGEFKEFFPENAVEYFVSYYDYYQPEAYVPSTDTYIEKDSSINDEIDKLRHSATASLTERRDVVIISSVSCIYGLGSPIDYQHMTVSLRPGMEKDRDDVIRQLVDIQFTRNDMDFHRGTFRVRGDTVEIFPASATDKAFRVEFFGDEVDRITEIDVLTGEPLNVLEHMVVFPASHYVVAPDRMEEAIRRIEAELAIQEEYFKKEGKLLELQRISERTHFDIEMLRETGFCSGIENYSMHLNGLTPADSPQTLLDYFPDDFLIIVDESHMTIPQIGGMYNGDQSRKSTLVDYGFRLPSAKCNRPLSFEEFESHINQMLFVSATPAKYEASHELLRAEQIIRPTGLLDPEVVVRPVRGQVDDLIGEIRRVVNRTLDEPLKGESAEGADGDRATDTATAGDGTAAADSAAMHGKVLVTTLTKRMAEDLTKFLKEADIRVQYLHSDIDTLERAEIIRNMRLDKFDVLVGINLLREGLDIPEVQLVAILDADKEGFLRSETSLIQTIGRAARNVDGRVIMYADTETDSMHNAIRETNRRREIQAAYNEEHGITPQTIHKAVRDLIRISSKAEPTTDTIEKDAESMSYKELEKAAREMLKKMNRAATELDFESAARYRDQMMEYKKHMQEIRHG